MKFNRKIMHFHPSRPDRLLGFNQSGELWAVVGKIEFAKTRPLDGWVRLSGDNPATITDVGGNELGVISNPCEDPMMRKYIETHIDELIYMLPGGGITFMYNPDDNRTVGYITRIE